jgi:hypothetical protein
MFLIKATGSSETSVPIYHNARSHIPENSNLTVIATVRRWNCYHVILVKLKNVIKTDHK